MLENPLDMTKRGLARNTNREESGCIDDIAEKLIEFVVKPFGSQLHQYPRVDLEVIKDGSLCIALHRRQIRSEFTHVFAEGEDGMNEDLLGKITFYLEPLSFSSDASTAILVLVFNQSGKVGLNHVSDRNFVIDMDRLEIDDNSVCRFVMDHLLHEVQARLERIEPK